MGARGLVVLGWTWTAGTLEDAPASMACARLGDVAVPYHPGYIQAPGRPLVAPGHTAATEVLGEHGFPTEAAFELGDLRLAIEPVAFAPVLLDDQAGRIGRFPRPVPLHRRALRPPGRGLDGWNQPPPR